jgi:hypothetical protein
MKALMKNKMLMLLFIGGLVAVGLWAWISVPATIPVTEDSAAGLKVKNDVLPSPNYVAPT